MTNRRFINGPLAGTRLEIMPSKAATTLPDGTPIRPFDTSQYMNATQALAAIGKLDVHAPQYIQIVEQETGENYFWEGPSIAQEWKILARGERPFYRRSNEDAYYGADSR
jgi:hypothetical protein